MDVSGTVDRRHYVQTVQPSLPITPVEPSNSFTSSSTAPQGHSAIIALGATIGVVTLSLLGFVALYMRRRLRRGRLQVEEPRFHIDPLYPGPSGGLNSTWNSFVTKIDMAHSSPRYSGNKSTASKIPYHVYDYGFRHLQAQNAAPATSLPPVLLLWTPPPSDSNNDASSAVLAKPDNIASKPRLQTEIQFTPPPRYTLAIINQDTL